MKKPAHESGLLFIGTNGLPTTLSARRGLYHRAGPEAKPMASTAKKFSINATTTPKPNAAFSMFGQEAEGMFTIRPGVSAYDAIEAAQGLLSAAHTLVVDAIHAPNDTSSACAAAFLIGAVQAIHTSIGFEV